MKTLKESILDIDKTSKDIDSHMEAMKEWTMSTEEWLKKRKKEVFGKWCTYVDPGEGISDWWQYKESMYIIGCNKPIKEFKGGTGYLYCVVMNAVPDRPSHGKRIVIKLMPDAPSKSNLENRLYDQTDYTITTDIFWKQQEAIEYAQKIIHLFTVMAEYNWKQFEGVWYDCGGIDADGYIIQSEIDNLTLDIE